MSRENRSRLPDKLAILTPNQKQSLIRKERERRRIARYIQVRRLSAQNASKIRERVKKMKEKELVKIKKQITDMLSKERRNGEIAVLDQMGTDHMGTTESHRRRPRQLTETEITRAIERHRNAMLRLKREREEEKENRLQSLEKRRHAQQCANVYAKRSSR